MTLSEIRDEVRFITRTDTTTYSNTDINREINIAYRKLAMEILKVQGYRNTFGKHASTTLISTDGLVSGDIGFNGEYPFPTDLIKPHRFEVKYDDDSELVVCKIIDMQENSQSIVEDSSVNKAADPTAPIIRFYHDSYFISPVKTTTGNISAGIHIWYEYRQTALSADEDTPEFEENFHDLIPLMVSERYYLRNPKKRNTQVIRDRMELMKNFRSHYRVRMNNLKKITPKQNNFK